MTMDETAVTDSPFKFTMLEPEAHKGPGALDFVYWAYRVHTSTTLEDYRNREMEVVRRYSDFAWFRAQLCENYPFCIVPPIPEKDVQGTLNKIMGSSSESAARLRDYRQRALRRFLTRLGAHPRLQRSTLLRDFLTMEREEWERKMKTSAKNSDGIFSTALGGGVNSALTRQWNTGEALERIGASYTTMITRETSAPHVWEETRLYIQQVEDSIKMLRDRLQMLVDRRRNTSKALYEFGVAFEKVGEIEGGIKANSVGKAIIAVGHHSEDLSSVYNEHANEEVKQVVETLSFYCGMCAAVRETLRRVQSMAGDVESTKKHMDDLAAQREKAEGQDGRREELEREIKLLRERWEESHKNVRDGESIFRDELQRFHSDKQYDIKGILEFYAKLQLKYSAKMKEMWESLRPTVEAIQIEGE